MISKHEPAKEICYRCGYEFPAVNMVERNVNNPVGYPNDQPHCRACAAIVDAEKYPTPPEEW